MVCKEASSRWETLLVLLPTSTRSKLLASWQRPYQITKRVGLVNYMYQVDMHDKRKRFRIFHVNMLKEYHLRPPMHTNCFNDEEGTEEEGEVPLWNDITKEQPKTGRHASHGSTTKGAKGVAEEKFGSLQQ